MSYLDDLDSARHFGLVVTCGGCGALNPTDYDSCHGCDLPAWECAHCGITVLGAACADCGGSVDAAEEPELAHAAWLNRQIGPRQVGGRYDHGYDESAYEVIAIDRGPRPTWPAWQITIRRDGRTVTHCTAWDPERDRILAQPH